MKKFWVCMGLMLALSASADIMVNYGWEDGGTILSSYGNLHNPVNVTTGSDPGTNDQNPSHSPALTVTPRSGSRMLQIHENPHSSTPWAFLAYVENLTEGDSVTASFWGWDSTPAADPSMRIWGHYALNGDVDSYAGSAGGEPAYTEGIPNGQWSQVSYTWTIDSGQEALVIEARLYSTPTSDGGSSTPYWIDDLQVIAPDSAVISIPETGTVGLFLAGGLIFFTCAKMFRHPPKMRSVE